ncbi:rhamnulokinase [Gracilibacillus caseinilyticus]|uniref:Rhamnulokinase n=1 Tax=Gracilibacillus caseinilyticus TaxID=2932256 RepID=A0ABY4F688_9BACI|nr:rhamnulokinase family protein [Gracilibacillus caseinilyticus]UOQ49961.1 rhamnulokinase [Gracilibacillus caseinilyticus]
MKKVWAFDIGASNGRLMLSSFDGHKLYLEEIYRFANQPVHLTGHYYWNILYIFAEMKKAMQMSIQEGHRQIESMGIDTWGVDFGLLSDTGELLGNPYSYRNPLNERGMQEALQHISAKELFDITGVETATINTVFQLYTIKKYNPSLLENADTLLLTPNLLAYLFCGEKHNEFTISSTTQLLRAGETSWDKQILQRLLLPDDILAPTTAPLMVAGQSLSVVNREIGMNPVKVIHTASHDTASAIASLPLEDQQSVFMSCGTWVLMGVPVDRPVINDDVMESGFTNEGTIEGKYRLQKNNMGMWLLQQCRVIWEREGMATDFNKENQLLEAAPAYRSFINPDDPRFFNPLNMVTEIQRYCEETAQPVPTSQGEIIRCILESLALKYGWLLQRLERLSGKELKRIHMGGGAIRNQTLCQLTANATGREIIAGPVEASAIGNAIGQWIALGEVKDLKEARQLVGESFPLQYYQPQEQIQWQEAYQRFVQYTGL